jgi:thiamine-phosphate pyrophosphorylase
MNSPAPIPAMAQAIVQAHSERFAPCTAQPVPASAEAHPAFQAALQACSALGFIAADALVLARAGRRRRCAPASSMPNTGPTTRATLACNPCRTRRPLRPAHARWACTLCCPTPPGSAAWRVLSVPTVQLRFKSDDPAAITHEVRAAVQAVQGTGALLFINDHWREAIAAGAYGVHLGQEEDALPAPALQELRASGLRLGVSTHGYAEMLRADAVGPSYGAGRGVSHHAQAHGHGAAGRGTVGSLCAADAGVLPTGGHWRHCAGAIWPGAGYRRGLDCRGARPGGRPRPGGRRSAVAARHGQRLKNSSQIRL